MSSGIDWKVEREQWSHIALTAPNGEAITAAAIIAFADALREIGATGPWPMDECDKPNHRICYTVRASND